MSKFLVCGDMHLRERLGYADVVADGRKAEKEEVFEFIRNASKGCDKIVFMGDQLNGRNNSSEVIRDFVAFIESLGKREIYIIAGN